MPWRHILEMALPFFLIMDPMGNLPACLALLRGHPPARQKRILLRELLLALGVIVAFTLAGDGLLGFLDISPSTLRVAGGVILFVIAIHMVFPRGENGEHGRHEADPFFVPIAVPLIAGPSMLSAAMLYAKQESSLTSVLIAILLAWSGAAAVLLAGPTLSRLLGDRGLRAAERLMGLVLILLSVQMLEDGVALFLVGRFPPTP